MRRLRIILIIAVVMITVTSCNPLKFRTSLAGEALEDEVQTSERIVFTNNKETTLKFTVSDPKVIAQVVSIIGEASSVEGDPGVTSDYTIVFYLPHGPKKEFHYWMGVEENEKTINFMGEDGMYYRIPDSMDSFIVNSTKMSDRPKYFSDLYSYVLSECISKLGRNPAGETIVGIDIASDRRMRRYTMSYEDERIFHSISVEGYKIEKLVEGGEYSYEVSYVTNIYNPDKAKITVEAVNVQEKTIETFIVNAVLVEDSTWEITMDKEE